MTYENFIKENETKDYILIKLTDKSPFFLEKVFTKDGEIKVEKNYHIADGMFSRYINFEMPDNGISAEISGTISFEITGKYDCPVYVMNTSENIITIRVFGISSCAWTIEAGTVVAIYPQQMAEEYDGILSELYRNSTENHLTQSEIINILGGEI